MKQKPEHLSSGILWNLPAFYSHSKVHTFTPPSQILIWRLMVLLHLLLHRINSLCCWTKMHPSMHVPPWRRYSHPLDENASQKYRPFILWQQRPAGITDIIFPKPDFTLPGPDLQRERLAAAEVGEGGGPRSIYVLHQHSHWQLRELHRAEGGRSVSTTQEVIQQHFWRVVIVFFWSNSHRRCSFFFVFAALIRNVNIKQVPVSDSITCSSERIYPQPELSWSTNPPSLMRDPPKPEVQLMEDQLYKISSTIVQNSTALSYSCTVSAGRNKRKTTLFKTRRCFCCLLKNPSRGVAINLFSSFICLHLRSPHCVGPWNNNILPPIKHCSDRSHLEIQPGRDHCESHSRCRWSGVRQLEAAREECVPVRWPHVATCVSTPGGNVHMWPQ